MEAWGGRVDELKHRRNLLKRETFERSPLQYARSGSLQIPAVKWLNCSGSVVIRVELRSKTENVSSESPGNLLQIDTDVSPSGFYSFAEKLIRFIQRSATHYGSLHKLEDEEQLPLHHAPLWPRLSSQVALGAVMSGLSVLISPQRASIPGGTWTGRVFSTLVTRGGVN